MVEGQLLLETQDVEVQRALERGAALVDACRAGWSATLYLAPLAGEALVLGRYQLAHQVIRGPALRRASGGNAVRAGSGILYAALALADRSRLMACPPGRLLNRNVRGMLTGLRLAGAKANYFGRDFISFGAQPAVYVGWDALPGEQGADGPVLLEFFVSRSRACFVPDAELSYPARREPGLRGQLPTTLQEASITASVAELLSAIAEGHAKTFGVDWRPGDAASLTPHPNEPPPTDDPHARSLAWSTPREEAIGFVSAGLALDGAGKVAAVRIAGDFFAHRSCMAVLERVLLGVSPTPELVGHAVDAAFAHAGYDVEGIRSLRTFQDAIIDAAAVAASVHDGPTQHPA